MPSNDTSSTSPTSKFPAGFYTPAQLALLSRSEHQLSLASDIMFHRDAHYQQWERSNAGREHMLPTYEEFMELGEDFAAITPESHKRSFLRHWENLRHHVIYRNLLPHQKAMLAEYVPEWVASREAKEQPAQKLTDHIQLHKPLFFLCNYKHPCGRITNPRRYSVCKTNLQHRPFKPLMGEFQLNAPDT